MTDSRPPKSTVAHPLDSPADLVERLEKAQLQRALAEEEARVEIARASAHKARLGVEKRRQEIQDARWRRWLKMAAMVAGLSLGTGGVVDEQNNWLPYADGTELVGLGVTGLIGSALGGRKKEEEDDEGK